MVYNIQTEGRKGSLMLSNHHAIVLHHGGQCRWEMGMKAWLIRAKQPRRERISCKGQIEGSTRCPSPPTRPSVASYNEPPCGRRYASHGRTAASSGTHTRWCRKQASSLALSGAPVAAGQASSLALWRARQRDVSIPEGGRGDTGRGLHDEIRVTQYLEVVLRLNG